MHPYPPCNYCHAASWIQIEHRTRDDGFIDFYRCLPCVNRLPEREWQQISMSWGYERPEQALGASPPHPPPSPGGGKA